MKSTSRLALAVVTAAAVAVPVLGTAPAEASARVNYDNCTTLHRTWKHGVGRARAHDHTSGVPVTNFFHSTRAYNRAMKHNPGLDRDKDGIACEAR